MNPSSAHFLPCLEALEPRLAPAGIVAVSLKGGALTLTGNHLANSVEISEAPDGRWKIFDNQADGTTFSLNGAAPVAELLVVVTGGVKVALQGGDDQLTFDGLAVGGPISLKDSGGNDWVNILGTSVNGTVQIDTGTGNDNVYLDESIFNSLVTVKSGTGDDSVNLSSGTYASITVDVGAGRDYFNLADPDAGDAIRVYGNVSITAKGGADFSPHITLAAQDLLITGSVKVKISSGEARLMLGLSGTGNVVVNGGFSYQGSSGTDSVLFNENISIGGKTEIKMGSGASTFLAADSARLTFGSFSFTGGSGVNTLLLSGAEITIGGDLVFNLPGIDNTLDFTASSSVFIAGNLLYKGGKGNDLLNLITEDLQVLGHVSFSSGAGEYNNLNLFPASGSIGSLDYKGGTGIDSLILGDPNDGTSALRVLGKVSANFGTGSNFISLFDASLHGDLTVLSSTQNTLGSQEIFTAADSTFFGNVILKTTGTADSLMRLNNSRVLGATTLDTGKGNDTVHLDRGEDDNGDLFSMNLFVGPVKILLGAGDDTVQMGTIGIHEDKGNAFNGPLFLDGGPGNDLAFYTPGYGNFFNGPVTGINFEPQVS